MPTAELMKELGSLILMIEAQLPANPESPKNLKLEKSLESDLKKYFRRIEQAIDMDALDRIYHLYVRE